MNPITQEQKIAIFDALVKEFSGHERLVGFRKEYKILPEDDRVTHPNPLYALSIEEKEIPTYEWVLWCEETKDFTQALLKMIPPSTEGAA